MVVIRPARAGEEVALGALAMRSKAHWGYTARQLQIWRAELAVRPESMSLGLVRVADHDGLPGGFCVLIPGGTAWILDDLWVEPNLIGRGLGRALLEHATQLAANAGASALTIDADPHAEAFYLACGALRVGSVAAPIEGDPARRRPQMRLNFEQGRPWR